MLYVYCLLNIYEGILTSASPMAACYQHVCKCFAMFIQLYYSTTHKTLFANQYAKKNITKIIYYYCCPWSTILMHVLITFASHLVIEQIVKLNGFTSKQYWRITPLIKYSKFQQNNQYTLIKQSLPYSFFLVLDTLIYIL